MEALLRAHLKPLGFRIALNLVPIIPRDASFSDSQCEFFHTDKAWYWEESSSKTDTFIYASHCYPGKRTHLHKVDWQKQFEQSLSKFRVEVCQLTMIARTSINMLLLGLNVSLVGCKPQRYKADHNLGNRSNIFKSTKDLTFRSETSSSRTYIWTFLLTSIHV